VTKLHFIWALLIISPLAFAEPAETPKPERTVSLASDYVTRELGSRLVIKQGKSIQLDKASKNSYSAEQMAAVRAVFGSDDPLVVKRMPAIGGRTNYSITVPANEYQTDKNRVKWALASMQVGVAQNGSLAVNWSLPFLSFNDKGDRFDLEDMLGSGTMQPDYWTGKSWGEIGKMRVTLTGEEGDGFTVSNTRFSNEFRRQGQFYGGLSEVNFGSFSTHGQSVDKVHLALRWRKLDAGAMAGLKLELDRLRSDGTDEDKASQLLARYVPLLKRLIKLGAALDIEDLSGSYNGQKVVIKGKLSMPNASDADFESGAAFFKKMAGRLDIAVPLPLLREIADAIARNDKSRQAEKMTVEQLSAQIYEMMLGKALANHYARLEKDVLRTTIELKGGLLAINGNLVPIEPLLALFEEKKLPPADTEPPVAIRMRDRGLEAAQLFALNGDGHGMLDMCDRTAIGLGVEKDPQQAHSWCTKAFNGEQFEAANVLAQLYLDGELDDPAIPGMLRKTADEHEYREAQYLMYRILNEGKGMPRDQKNAAAYLRKAADRGYPDAVKAMKETDADYLPPEDKASDDTTKDSWSFPASVQGGYYLEQDFRFNKDKHRRLTLSMDNLQPHEKWGPMLAVCASAINPSDVACFNLIGQRGETPSILVKSDIHATRSPQRTNEKWLETELKPGDQIDLVVYASDKQVHFVVNGNDSLVQQVNFPVEVLMLNCSTADCKFNVQH